jgi:two-component sensor histidine kinase
MKQTAGPAGLSALGHFLKSNLATLLAGLGMFLTVHLVDALLSAMGLHAEATYLDDVLLGVLAALLVFFLQWRHRLELRRHERCAAAIEEINHHIRNALQVIALRTSLDARSRDELIEIREASARIEWVLRELVPSLATHHHEDAESSQNAVAAPWR